MAVAVVTAFGAAVLLGLGFVIQQRNASEVDEELVLSPKILLRLVRNPKWLTGIACMVGGQILGAIALGLGGLGLAEPIMGSNLLFALFIVATFYHQRLRWREWLGALLLVGGLSGFIIAGAPAQGTTRHVPPLSWAAMGVAVASTAAILVYLAKRHSWAEEAAYLAGGAGVLYGLQDALTKRAFSLSSHDPLALLTSWPAYLLVAVAIVGMVLAQSAFRSGPLTSSLAPVTAAEPITGIAIGAGMYSEHLRMSPAPLMGEIASLVVMVVGIWTVARSPLVCTPSEASPQ